MTTENHDQEQTAESQTKPSKRHACKMSLLKAGFTAAVLAIFYGGYLDWQIRSKMDGQIWRLPAEVYSRIESVKISDNLAFDEVIQILLDNEYRQTTMVAAPGDFKLEDNDTIIVLRRAFPFPDKPEPQRVLRLRFTANKLSRIEDLVTVKAVDEFRLAPKLIAMLESDNEDRLAIPLQNYPRLLIDALILTEDRRFYEHNGINPIGIMRAMIANIRAGQTVQGGSTLTQQLVKNLFLSSERTITRKANEALMALVLDWRYDKNRILETYLNEIYLGQNGDTQIHGFELASQFYFGRSIREISLDQIALLVGMVKGPSLYNPWRNPQNALERRNVVLKLMLDHQMIGDELYELLSKRPLGVQAKGQISRKYPAFIQTLQADLRRQLGEHKMSGLLGARIFTTMDLKQQEQSENAVVNTVSKLQVQTKNPHLEGAMIVADYRTGEIRSIVGGLQTQYAGFNRAFMAKRQIGSLVKPSIYLTALSHPEQFRLNTPINNQPITINVKGSAPWQPRNYDRKYSGSVMLMDALARSLNIPTVNIGMKVGLSEVIDTQKAMGWDNLDIPKMPSMLLGSYSISPYDVTKLYQTIANQGSRIDLTTVDSIADRQGNVIYQHDKESKQVVPQEAAFQTLFAMQQTVERGTARSLQNDYADLHLAGKTGTTNDARDTWFVGIDGKNVSTIWLGRDDNGETKLTGASGALQIYKDYLTRVYIEKLKLEKPKDIKWVGITSHGSWDCGSNRVIPVWANNGQNFCSSSSTASSNTAPSSSSAPSQQAPEEPRGSLWDVLDNKAPIEEAKPE